MKVPTSKFEAWLAVEGRVVGEKCAAVITPEVRPAAVKTKEGTCMQLKQQEEYVEGGVVGAERAGGDDTWTTTSNACSTAQKRSMQHGQQVQQFQGADGVMTLKLSPTMPAVHLGRFKAGRVA